MATKLVSLISEANVCEKCEGTAVCWDSLAPGSSRVSSYYLRHACVLLSILFVCGCEWLHSLVRKDKMFSSVNKGGVVFMLHLLLWYPVKGTLPSEVACSAESSQEALRHGLPSQEFGIKFTPHRIS